jgi:hypothetical protein
MTTLTILAFLIEKREIAEYRLRAMGAKRPAQTSHPLTQVKVIYENLPMETHGATAPNLEIKRYERQYLDAAP